jgi:hypothetical protein
MAETKEALIVVKTYPTPAEKGTEVSCTAAITRAGEWLRLFPVPFRRLDDDQRFRKYQWVEVSVIKASDARRESYRLDWAGSAGSPIRILSDALPTDHEWRARKEIVLPLKAHCMCCLRRLRDENGFPTLGMFRPRSIQRLVIEDDEPSWSANQLAIRRQESLFEEDRPQQDLEKIPHKFSYQFRCEESTCPGHTMMCADWKIGESWRAWKTKYGDNWEEKFRQRWETEMIEKYDTHFYVGTVNKYPSAWIIVGVFYPPKPQVVTQGKLFL